MSEIALYDTLRKIPEVSDEEAKQAVADIANSREVATKADIAELKAATKADIAELKAETKADIAELKAETKADIKDMATKTDIAELKAEMYRVNNRTIMWIVGVGVAVAGIVIAVAG